MRGRLFCVIVAVAAFGIALCVEHPLLPELNQQLDQARRCLSRGRVDEAMAHASLVAPNRCLRVGVDCSNVPPADQGLFRTALSGAFRMWQEALGTKVFEVSETAHPDVVIHFQPNVCDSGTEVCGHSHWTRGVVDADTQPRAVFAAEVQVRMFQPNGQPLTLDQLRACAAHELGHVLGLDDSSGAGDVMSRMDFNRPAIAIRAEEVDALITARNEAVRIRETFADRSTKFKQ